jgi:hypothetical protein
MARPTKYSSGRAGATPERRDQNSGRRCGRRQLRCVPAMVEAVSLLRGAGHAGRGRMRCRDDAGDMGGGTGGRLARGALVAGATEAAGMGQITLL